MEPGGQKYYKVLSSIYQSDSVLHQRRRFGVAVPIHLNFTQQFCLTQLHTKNIKINILLTIEQTVSLDVSVTFPKNCKV